MSVFGKRDNKNSQKHHTIKNRFVIYIGLKDKETLSQKQSTKECILLVRDICKEQKLEFTLIRSMGGYVNSEGDYIIEEGFQLSLLGVPKRKAIFVADELKRRLNQETVIVTDEKMIITHIIN